MSSGHDYDVCIVGAGLVGLAVGRALIQSRPGLALLIVDKEPAIASHQSSHNSGVLHSGLYYRPGSLKAQLCAEGRRSMEELCDQGGIAWRRCGKVVVATEDSGLAALDELERRGTANGLGGLIRLGPDGLRDVEPHATGLAALYVPEAGVVDFPAVAEYMAAALIEGGVTILTGREVTEINDDSTGAAVTLGEERVTVRALVNCAGLQSDRVARLAGIEPSVRIVPFRGEYYRLADDAAGRVRALIYPVPDPRFPFLGVHFTRRVDGTVEVGPNAVLALGREQYQGEGLSVRDIGELVRTPGLWSLAMRHWRSGLRELLNSRSKRRYARLASRLVPGIEGPHLLRGGSGVRAQAIARDGSLVDDFVIERVGSSVHVLNAPSPGATASLAIGRFIAGQVFPLLAG